MLLHCYVPAGLLCMLYSLILNLLRIETRYSRLLASFQVSIFSNKINYLFILKQLSRTDNYTCSFEALDFKINIAYLELYTIWIVSRIIILHHQYDVTVSSGTQDMLQKLAICIGKIFIFRTLEKLVRRLKQYNQIGGLISAAG